MHTVSRKTRSRLSDVITIQKNNTEFHVILYDQINSSDQHIAIVKGNISNSEFPVVRVQYCDTYSELLDVLVYIDSLRAPDGSSDVRFHHLQNDIVHEIGSRKRKAP